MILFCEDCKPHAFQDERYGKNMRVHNYAQKGLRDKPGYRCTICLNVRGGGKNESVRSEPR